MIARWAMVASLVLTSLMLMPAGAHLLALPNKIGMSSADYLVAQQAYRGWAAAGVLVFSGIAATAIFAWRVRHSHVMFRPAIVALCCLIATQLIFWILVYPGNQATDNWTMLPANWEDLRSRWELGHALSAVLNVVALLALVGALLQSDPLLPRNSGEAGAFLPHG